MRPRADGVESENPKEGEIILRRAAVPSRVSCAHCGARVEDSYRPCPYCGQWVWTDEELGKAGVTVDRGQKMQGET